MFSSSVQISNAFANDLIIITILLSMYMAVFFQYGRKMAAVTENLLFFCLACRDAVVVFPTKPAQCSVEMCTPERKR